MRRVPFYILVSLFLFGAVRAEAAVVVSALSEAERLSARYTIGAIRMDGEQLRLVSPDGVELAAMPMARVRRIVFCRDVPTDVEQVESSAVRVYPSPAVDRLLIDGQDADTPYRIYDTAGHCMLSGVGTVVSVGGLAPGTYILLTGFHMQKFIKQ